MTRAVVATAYGDPSVLQVVDVEVGPPGPGEVVIDLRAAGVNPADVKSYSGAWGTDPAALPKRLGYEGAGVISAVGADAVGPAGPLAVGDEVIAWPVLGAYAEQLRVRGDLVVPRPTTLSWEQSSGLLLAGGTAMHTVVAAEVGTGDTVLVHGGAGGVGLMVVQLAVSRGARVIATAGADNHDLLRRLGAEPVLYGDGLADRVRALAPDGVAAAIDTVGSDEAVDVSLDLVADRGRIVTIAAFGRAPEAGIKLLGVGGDPGDELRKAARLDLVRDAAAGRLAVFVAATYPLAEAARAHEDLTRPHGPGKFALVI
jgi:NADPH:quinone reductase-like Zn-dependent oxidoreductase